MPKIQTRKFGYEIHPTIQIQKSPQIVRPHLIDLENWWVDSNDEHISLQIHAEDKSLKLGTRIVVKEKIAGIPCLAEGNISEIAEEAYITWLAQYYLLGLKWLHVNAGVKWQLNKSKGDTELSANVWSKFPENFAYRILFNSFKAIRGIEKDFRHAQKELEFLKRKIEQN